MLSNQEYLIPKDKKVSLVSIVCTNFDGHRTQEESESSLLELQELMRTLEIPYHKGYLQTRKQLDPATLIGSGKLNEIAKECNESGVETLVFDFELTASQMRNIQKITKLEIIDRCNVILEIFAKHARTADAKIQIEISRLEYLLPRLTSMWGHFSRQKGGVGLRGGEGEQQLELDRRIIRDRISKLKKQLVGMQTSAAERKKKRSKQVLTAALVGYTNAGKSSLMNRLCQVEMLEENKLFATLDSTYRTLNPDTKPPMVLIDTVGFLSNLPNTLINGFKTTLESAIEADLLILVCDISSPDYKKHIQVTENVLAELGALEKDRVIVFNKRDLVEDRFTPKMALRKYPNSFLVSSFDKLDVKMLREHIVNHFLKQQPIVDLFVPYDNGQVHSQLAKHANIVLTNNTENGIYYRIRLPDWMFQKLNLQAYALKPDDPMLTNLTSREH